MTQSAVVPRERVPLKWCGSGYLRLLRRLPDPSKEARTLKGAALLVQRVRL